MNTFPANGETFTVLAWLAQDPRRGLAFEQKMEEGRRFGRTPDAPALLRSLLEEEYPIGATPVWGPVWMHLLHRRCAQVDLDSASWALNGRYGVYFRADYSPQAEVGDEQETLDLWEVVAQNAALFARLEQFSRTWPDNVCTCAAGLRTYFFSSVRLGLRYQDVPQFVPAFIVMSLERIDWHVLASRLLREAKTCQCVSQPHQENPAVLVALFAELLGLVGDEIRQVSRSLPGQQRSTALFLSGLCRDTASALAVSESVETTH